MIGNVIWCFPHYNLNVILKQCVVLPVGFKSLHCLIYVRGGIRAAACDDVSDLLPIGCLQVATL